MSHKIITIGRQFGCNGLTIGQKLSERLGILCFDKNLIELASQQTDIPYDQMKIVDEVKEKPWQYLADVEEDLDKQYRFCHIDQLLFEVQSDVIKEIAAQKDCIFIGRCANDVLKDEPRLKSIFLYAPEDVRVKTIMERYNFDEKKARSTVRKADKERSYYYSYYTDKKWKDIENYDLSIDTSAFSIDEILDMLEIVYNNL